MINYILILVIFFVVSIIYYSRRIVLPKVYTHEEILKYESDNSSYNEADFNDYQQESVVIQSPFGYHLTGKLILQDITNKFVVMCHGFTSNYDGMKKYCDIYLEMGYSVLLYDHRNHGNSQKNFTSFGFFEKDDAKACIDMLFSRFNAPIIGVHGESMGASTALQLVTIDHRIDFCVEDCGFSNAHDLFHYRSKKDKNAIIAMLTKPTNIYLKLFYGWSFGDVSVVNYINKAKCPIMFIHGSKDDYVPFYMVNDLYEAYNGVKELLVIEDAKHANCINKNHPLYKEKVQSFIKKNGVQQ